jgi:hypothetical protein
MLNIANLKDFLLLVFYFMYAVLLPGYWLTRIIVSPKQLTRILGILPGAAGSLLYRHFYYLFSPAVGLVLLDAAVLILSKVGVSLGFWQLFGAFSLINCLLYVINRWKIPLLKAEGIASQSGIVQKNPWILWAFAVLFLAGVIIRTVFYLPDVVPQDTDLGHHMYFSEWIVQHEELPAYDTSEVIVGEHLIFAVLSILSGVPILSALALLVLAFYNFFTIGALYFATLALSSNQRIALLTLFFSGIYFAIDPPGARYVKGGVVGNIIGNYFIALIFMLVFLSFRWVYKYLTSNSQLKNGYFKPIVSIVSLLVVILAGLFYTHHLSTFLLLIMLVFTFIFFLTLPFWRGWNNLSSNWRKTLLVFKNLFLARKFLIILTVIVLFPLVIYIPYYLEQQAVNTVVGTPIKDTRLGIQLDEAPGKFGLARTIFAILGLLYALFYMFYAASKKFVPSSKSRLILFFREIYSRKTRLFSVMFLAVFVSWFLPLAILSFFPQLVKIDLPSRRVINYQVYPVIIFAALGAYLVYEMLISKIKSKKRLWLALAIAGLLVFWDGTSDFRSVYTGSNKFGDAVALYHASQYLAEKTSPDAIIIKDHRSIPGDSWMKLFLMRGYDYFLSRTYDYKYESIDSQLDICTKEVIDLPESNAAVDCFGQKGINYVVLKPRGDDFLFWKTRAASPVYHNDAIVIFKMN